MAEAGILVGVPEFRQCALLTRKWRPPEFVKKQTYVDDSEDESTVGKMPPAEESDSGE